MLSTDEAISYAAGGGSTCGSTPTGPASPMASYRSTLPCFVPPTRSPSTSLVPCCAKPGSGLLPCSAKP
eukprot:3479615-Rhodomonas_salina.1